MGREDKMKVERFCDYDTCGYPTTATIRVMRTTCPLCQRSVQFAMQDEDFIREDNHFLEKQNERFKREIERLNSIIDKLTSNL
jgi:hypothetical protein